MADSASTNGHRPVKRSRKHIYPPVEQMEAEQAAAAARVRPARQPRADASRDFGPEADAPPAAPVMTMAPPDEVALEAEAGEPLASDVGSGDDGLGTNDDVAAVHDALADDALADDELAGDGERVELRLSAVGMVDAADISFAQGALGAARADNVVVEQGALGAALADRVEVSRGYARSILARQVQLDSAAARVIVAADVTAERTAVMFLIARRVAGDVRVLLDWRGAVAFGAAVGLVMGLLRRRGKASDTK
jgi:hypothetical protein